MPASSASETLKKLDFFAGLPDTVLWHLGRAAEKKTLAQGEYLFRAGQPRSMLAIILKGRISIDQNAGPEALHITSLGEGEVIGEGILLEETQHGTDGHATEPTELLVLPKDPLFKLVKDQPAVYGALLNRAARIMNKRIRSANLALVGMTSEFSRAEAVVGKLLGDITTLGQKIGYEQAVALARDAFAEGRDIRDLARERQLIS